MIAQISFKEPLHSEEIITADPETVQEEETGVDKRILCRTCHAHITDKNEEISINGSDYHLFKNPAGIYFRVVCFENAGGCKIISDYTEMHTWFEGYSWAIALCSICHSHLGWHYISLDRTFYGLIADRLTGV
ncbi:MAG TPA: cereblon family protein [Spirochaetota bacterium]|nr:cereblon family protein [Spirochaetota bacterium]HPF07042.1 cereblon family protein [Spirochaetota bacterium]HPJ40691.1 cereblon family protein [Spirochaetota bacterium]HPR35959.1 cereblon family protein [Spirochaetota bacterium]HRX48309.1 cereblon family protein [Spirochaetota bacterium]